MSAAGPARRRRFSLGIALDWFFFVFAGAAAVWLAYLSATETFAVGWWGIPLAVVFWVLLAYLVLPRLHRILTTIYVPDYFIGRTRTSDGLLGDPVNLALMGEAADIEDLLRRAGWTRADPVTLASSWRIVTSTLRRRSYHEAPVSPLFLFGRAQDFAYQQEVDGNPAQRHHVRFWRCPDGWLLPGGRRVEWLAAGTFDRAVGLSLFTLQVTHRIDADTDIERDHIIRTVRDADPRVRVDVIEDFATGYHARNGGGDTIRTDGDLPILDVRRTAAARRRGRPFVSALRASLRGRESAPPPPVADVSTRSPGEDASSRSPSARGETTRPAAGRKRAAFEPAAQLLSPVRHDPGMRRPAATVTGGVLVLLRVVAGILWMVAVGITGPAWLQTVDASIAGIDLSPGEGTAVIGAVLVAVGIGLAIELALGVFILRGRNFPRVVVMFFSVTSISAAFAGWWLSDQDIRLTTTLLTLALDILVLLALSSRSAAAYARRNERR